MDMDHIIMPALKVMLQAPGIDEYIESAPNLGNRETDAPCSLHVVIEFRVIAPVSYTHLTLPTKRIV